MRRVTPSSRAAVIVSALALLVSVGANVVGYHVSGQNRELIRQVQAQAVQGAAAYSADCSLKDDLAQRVSNTEDYLSTHPGDILLGVPRSTITNALSGQKKTLRSLDGLTCPK